MKWRRARQVLAVTLVVVVALAANAGWRWWHNRPPFGPQALSLESSIELVGFTESREALGQPVYYAPSLEPKVQMVLGRVSWRPPPEPLDGRLLVVVIDKRSNHLPETIELRRNWPRVRDRHDPAWVQAGGVQDITQRYPWLRGVGKGSIVWADDQTASPLTFAARFPPAEERPLRETAVLTGPVAISDLLLAVVCIGSDDQIYWAHRLQG